ncbi:hypothetical protein EJB05_54068, partial [Eragrostis curvula]
MLRLRRVHVFCCSGIKVAASVWQGFIIHKELLTVELEGNKAEAGKRGQGNWVLKMQPRWEQEEEADAEATGGSGGDRDRNRTRRRPLPRRVSSDAAAVEKDPLILWCTIHPMENWNHVSRSLVGLEQEDEEATSNL